MLVVEYYGLNFLHEVIVGQYVKSYFSILSFIYVTMNSKTTALQVLATVAAKRLDKKYQKQCVSYGRKEALI